MILLAQAQARLKSRSRAVSATEALPLSQALGRIAAQDICSGMAIPCADNSAMDGFAVRVADVIAGVKKEEANKVESAVNLPVSQRLPAGAKPAPLDAGTAARIFTGALIPPGADAVVIQEHCGYSATDAATVTIRQAVSVGANIRSRGEDIQQGAVVVKQGQRLNAIDVSLLASIGMPEVTVFKRLKVAIFSTGDELIEPGQPLNEGQIYNSNRPLLMALCAELGYETLDCGTVADTLDATKLALRDAASKADIILSSGGVSVGEEDHIKPAIEAIGTLDMWKVRIKPGKPVAYGQVERAAFLGLPGNPVSSFVVFQLLAVPLMRALQGETNAEPQAFKVTAGFDKGLATREEYIRVKLRQDDSGGWLADRFPNLSSGVLSSLSWADGLVRHDVDTSIESGQVVDFLPMRRAML